MIWDMYMMATIWVLWNERSTRIFNHSAVFMLHLLDSMLHFVNFWATNPALPLKKKVDTYVLTYACERS